eukprot:TRINITY_DN5304_c0_g1_i1.p1 TRINITY_DN5304_c0_g1~~TRINITY_DN5304_c0_g1_i1.p1  ORF type:complete len:1056 (+),score=422.58 TRINITY_DN5304_c0_g1_i1:123-3290(+)
MSRRDFSVLPTDAERRAANAELEKVNEKKFEQLIQDCPKLGEAYGSADCKRWEIEQTEGAVGSDETHAQLSRRLQERHVQHKIVVELINIKLKENYTRFVAGMNKINDVGDCSEQTTMICDEGKTRLKLVKEGLVMNALSLTQKHRRRQNLLSLRSLAGRMKVIADLQHDTRRLMSEKRYAEAAIAISKGLQHARTLGLSDLACVQQILARWTDERDRLFYKHIDKDMNESCKCFDAAKYELCVQAISGMGLRYVEESAKSLPDKWRSAIGLAALASVMPYAGDITQASEAVSRANLRQMMKMINSNNAALAIVQLLANLSHNAWAYHRTVVLLRGRVSELSATELDGDSGNFSLLQTSKLFLSAMEGNRGNYFKGVQSKVSECFSSIQIHSLNLQSFFVLTFAFQMLCVLGKAFGEGVSTNLKDLVGRFQSKYLSEVMHKEACEITRIEMVFDHSQSLSMPQLVEKLASHYDVSLRGHGDASKRSRRLAGDGSASEIPPQLLLTLMLQKAKQLLDTTDPSQNPFLRALRNNTKQNGSQGNEHTAALLSFFAPEELQVVRMNMHTLGYEAGGAKPSSGGSARSTEEAPQYLMMRDESICLGGTLTESAAEVLLRVLRYEELLESSESVGDAGTQNTPLVLTLLEQFVSFYAYTVVVNFCGVAGRSTQSSVAMQWYSQSANAAGASGGAPPSGSAKPTCPELPTPIKSLDAVASRDSASVVAFLVTFPEKDPRVPSNVRLTLEEMRQSALTVLKFKEVCGPTLQPNTPAPEGQEAAPQMPSVQSTSIENAFLAHYLRVQNVPLLKKLVGGSDAYALAERFAALDSASRVLEALSQLCKGQDKPRAVHLGQTAEKLCQAMRYMSGSFTRRIASLLFPVDAYPKLVAESKWERKTLESEPSTYVHAILKEVRRLKDVIADMTETQAITRRNATMLWTSVAEAVWAVLIEGFSRVKKCTNEGRALMSLDVQSIHHALKSASNESVPSAEPVEDFVKAFYLEGEDYSNWVRESHVRYTTKQLLSLCTINTGVLDRKRKDRQEMQRRLEEMLRQLEHVDPL